MKITINTEAKFRGQGVLIHDQKPTLFYSTPSSGLFLSAESDDGLDFQKIDRQFEVYDMGGQAVDSRTITNIRLSPLFKGFIMFFETYEGQNGASNSYITHVAISDDGLKWQTVSKLPEVLSLGVNVENYVYKNQHVFYLGGAGITVGLTDKGQEWSFMATDIRGQDLEIDYTLKVDQGIFVLYHNYSHINSNKHLEVKAVCFSKENPSQILWQTKNSLWQMPPLWRDKDINCLGSINMNEKLLSYWNIDGLGIFSVSYPVIDNLPAHEHRHYEFTKQPANPVLSPNSENEWENEATFNPAAFYDNEKVYLIYRAVGHDYISVLGYAESTDGINFDRKFDSPIFTGSKSFDTRSPRATFGTTQKYMSGGGYGGCEDPRITRVDDRLYMVYVAFNGYSEPRLALTSILYKDFIKHRFLWEKPVLISPPGIVDKSGCILPEKINGKYVVFHRIYPNILIDFVDNLNFDGSTWLKGEFKIEPRPTMWDSRKIGVGAPPIRTKEGWLLIYQGVNDRDDSKYRIGAMLLDLKDPTKVLYRTNHPIIEPTEHYENGLAKFGIVYPCGAVVVENILMIYYGGSDSVTCVASANLDEFLEELKSGNGAHLNPVKIND